MNDEFEFETMPSPAGNLSICGFGSLTWLRFSSSVALPNLKPR
jgi:hypothetical protein